MAWFIRTANQTWNLATIYFNSFMIHRNIRNHYYFAEFFRSNLYLIFIFFYLKIINLLLNTLPNQASSLFFASLLSACSQYVVEKLQ